MNPTVKGSPNRRARLIILLSLIAACWTDLSAAQPIHIVKAFESTPVNPYSGVVQGTDGFWYGTTSTGGVGGNGAVYRVESDGSSFSVVHAFLLSDGASPLSGVIDGGDGYLYGATYFGGSGGSGTLYRVSPDGSGFALLHSFAGPDGAHPVGGLLKRQDGYFYGTTVQGGSAGDGVVFRVEADGSGFSVLYSFTGADGMFPYAGVSEGGDGYLYGATYFGGGANLGTLFRIQPDGGAFSLLHSFSGSDGSHPKANLTVGGDGYVYGTAEQGGVAGYGTVFRLQPDGGSFMAVHSFTNGDGGYPDAAVMIPGDGFLYGTTNVGGSFGEGTIFRLSADGVSFAVMRSLSLGDGAHPAAGLAVGVDGRLYGTAPQGGIGGFGLVANGGNGGFGTLYRLQTDGGGFAIVHYFVYGEGAQPYGGVTAGADGYLYGTTFFGGARSYGAVYRVKTDGTGFAVLHSFANSDGANPLAGLIKSGDGYFYGTTYYGGSSGFGTVYRVLPDGTAFSVVHSFSFGDGAYPQSTVLDLGDGFLYGTTYFGGAGFGTLYRVRPDGTGFGVLRAFTNADGAYPFAPVIRGTDGYLYGTTLQGSSNPYGSIYRVGPDGSSFSIVHAFANTDGAYPVAGLLLAPDGSFYGTTIRGGDDGEGAVYRLQPDGSGFEILHSFSGVDGETPYGGVLNAADGYLYGTTYQGGSNGLGTAYRLKPDGSGFISLNSFGGNDGSQPYAGLADGGDGMLYGSTEFGGESIGVVFRLRLPNTSPVISNLAISSTSIMENSSVTLSGSVVDPDSGDNHTVSIAWGDGSAATVLNLAAGVLAFSASHQYLDDNPTGTASDLYGISVVVTDSAGASGTGATSVTVNNVASVIASLTSPTAPIAIGGAATVSATFTDVGSLDTHICVFVWDDGSSNTTVTPVGTGNGSCSASHTYAAAGVYDATVNVTDDDTGSVTGDFGYIVVYDPNGGFVTGGGWFNSPAGAYPANPPLTGKANFGFVARYQNNRPVGETEFHFADLNLHSTSYDWLVISGAQGQYQGSGTVNDAGNYGFLVTVIDGQASGGGGTDKIRVKIWDKNNGNAVVYDNQPGAPNGASPTTPIGGGSIVLHN